MNMQAVSDEQREIARKNGARIYSAVLQRLAEVTQERVADCMGVHASTISRMKEDLERVCQLLAACGFQLAPVKSIVVDQNEQLAMESMALKWLQARHQERLEAIRRQGK